MSTTPTPTPTTTPSTSSRPAGRVRRLGTLLPLLRPVRGRVLLLVALTAAAVGLGALGPLALGRATDVVFDGFLGSLLPDGLSRAEAVAALREDGQDTFAGVVAGSDAVPGRGVDGGALARALAIALGLFGGAAVLQLLAAGQLNHALHAVMRDLRRRTETKVNRTPVAVADAQGRGDLLSRVTNDVDTITVSLTQGLGQLLSAAMTLAVTATVMVVLSPVLALAAFATLPLAVLGTRALMRRSQRRFAAQWAALGQLSATVEEGISGHEVSTAFHRADEHVARFAEHNDRLAEEGFRAQAVSGLAAPLMTFVGNLSYVVICVLGGLRVASGAMTVGGVQAFVQYARQTSQPISEISGMLNELQAGVAAAERVLEFLEGPEEDAGHPAPWRSRGALELREVTFGYDPDRPVLHEVSLHAAPGETVAVVGPTGAGKSTLVNLLLRFHEPQDGSVLLDGRDVRDLALADLRSRVGLVAQDPWLFAGTIAENIAYGREGATRAEVERAAALARVDSFAHGLPAGLDTPIGPEGASLSAGQRQLVTIARALVCDAEVLVLDEATSSVDPRTSALVQDALAALRRDRTCLVIAHRLATIRSADRIVVLDEGRVVESGTHAELVESAGLYADLQRRSLVPA